MNAAEPVTRRPKAWEALAAQLILRFLRISERLSRDQSRTRGQCWARVYMTLLHLKVDFHRAVCASRVREEWPEPALKPPASRFDFPPGEFNEEEVSDDDD